MSNEAEYNSKKSKLLILDKEMVGVCLLYISSNPQSLQMNLLSHKYDLLPKKCLNIIAAISLLVITQTNFAYENLSLFIDSSEGGNISQRNIEKLINYLQQQQCNVTSIVSDKKSAASDTVDLFFSPLKITLPDSYIKMTNLKIINDERLAGSILVRSSTGITDLSSLQGVRMSFLSFQSVTGYKLQNKMFEQLGIKHQMKNIMFSETNLAAFALLSHKDVFAAAMASPLANKWGPSNDLHIVATSDSVVTGGIWVKQNLAAQTINNCRQAFIDITNPDHGNIKLLKIFPAWLDRFTI